MILVLSALTALLSQLVSSQGAPHTAILISRANGSVIAHHHEPTVAPFPPHSLSDRDEQDRAKLYAAVGVSTWEEEQVQQKQQQEEGVGSTRQVLMLETEVSRSGLRGHGSYL